MTNNKEPTLKELQANLEASKRSLLDNMELYGYPRDQAEIQVQAVIDATRKLAELELY